MGKLLTDPIFPTWLVHMKAALEDSFSWVDLLADWHGELHQTHVRHLSGLRNERLARSYRDTTPSYAAFYVSTSLRHLQESIVHALQFRHGHMAVEVCYLEKVIDQAEQLRDSQWLIKSALSHELEYLERLLPILDYHVL
ncbi:hypothetical protein LIER_23231 [Lithospermum erythrorhizon]|uniref:Uncharacterized protein n=1 Tax=Lithospermum erythrorhizon TaxID=34254 RepID=A0AAV3QY07_LITER